MTDFIADMVRLLETKVPELRNKIQPGMVVATTQPPYAAYSDVTEEPIRTKDGIAGMKTYFELALFHSSKIEASKLKNSIIAAIDSQTIAAQKVIFQSSEGNYNDDYKLHGYILTFKIS